MSLTVFARNSPIYGGSSTQRALSTQRGNSIVTAVTNTQASGTQVQCTQTGGGSLYELFLPIEAWTGAAGGSIVYNIRAQESNAAANVRLAAKADHVASDGTTVKTALHSLTNLGTGELTTSNAAQTGTVAVATPSGVTSGDMIRIQLYGVNVGTMASGYTFTVSYNGPSGGNGDTYITLPGTVTPKAFGVDVIGDEWGNPGGGYTFGNFWTAPKSGNIDRLRCYLRNTTGSDDHIMPVVMSVSGGTPDSLLAGASGSITVPAGTSASWFDLMLSAPLAVVAGTTYYLGYDGDPAGSGNMELNWTEQGPGDEHYKTDNVNYPSQQSTWSPVNGQGTTPNFTHTLGAVYETAADTSLTGVAAALVWSGTTARSTADAVATAHAGALAWSGTTALADNLTTVPAAAATLAWSGTTATILSAAQVPAAAAAMVWSGTTAMAAIGVNAAASAGALAWSGTTAATTVGAAATAHAATLAWSGTTATAQIGVLVPARAGSFVWSGAAPTLDIVTEVELGGPAALVWAGTTGSSSGSTSSSDISTTAHASALAWSGTSPAVQIGATASARSAAIIWSGTTAAAMFGSVIPATAASIAWSGTTAGTSAGITQPARAATLAWSGTTADATAAESGDVFAAAGAAAITWSGTAATVQATALVVARSAAITWSATTARSVSGSAAAAESGSLAWSGTAANVLADTPAAAGTAVIAWSGGTARVSNPPLVVRRLHVVSAELLTTPAVASLSRSDWSATLEV